MANPRLLGSTSIVKNSALVGAYELKPQSVLKSLRDSSDWIPDGF